MIKEQIYVLMTLGQSDIKFVLLRWNSEIVEKGGIKMNYDIG